MIARTPEERQAYDDRLKAERDKWARTEQAKLEGRIEGETKSQARLVAILQGLIRDPVESEEALVSLGLDRLREMESDLKQRLRDLV